MLTFKPFETSLTWHFFDPDTHYKHMGGSKVELIRNIVNYRSNNKLEPIERLDLVIDHYLCSLIENCGKCIDTPLTRGFMQYLKGGISLVQNLYYKKFADEVTAQDRANICFLCPCNMFPDKDAFMAWSDSIAYHSVGEREVEGAEKLGSCMACSCVMKAKVWYTGPFDLTDDEKDIMRACNKDCWQLKELAEENSL